jgi:hypothetical protein
VALWYNWLRDNTPCSCPGNGCVLRRIELFQQESLIETDTLATDSPGQSDRRLLPTVDVTSEQLLPEMLAAELTNGPVASVADARNPSSSCGLHTAPSILNPAPIGDQLPPKSPTQATRNPPSNSPMVVDPLTPRVEVIGTTLLGDTLQGPDPNAIM